MARERRQEKDPKTRKLEEKEQRVREWVPKTKAGKLVQEGKITDYNQIIEKNMPVLEPEIIDALLPDLEEKIFDVTKTTKVTRSGRNFRFRVAVLVGDKKEFIGIGVAKDREKWPAVRKATKQAKLNLIKVGGGCGSWECTCSLRHSVPFTVTGKSASVKVTLKPAPRGTGLVVGDNIKDVLKFVGIEDVWSSTQGSTSTKLNFVRATIDALSKIDKIKISEEISKKLKKK